MSRPTKQAPKRTYLCKEYGGPNCPDEHFTVTAKDADDAAAQAELWNAVVIREVKPQ